MWPNKGELDPRPIQGTGYVKVQSQRPLNPVVPMGAVGELKVVN
ncbi:unannotated protein [freshwater metagenome]|uniref:Unannotated protein n=1 Tax=freshwater metagenome TaxID=449393 RepID=A0A6J6HPY1_9ZZZZ